MKDKVPKNGYLQKNINLAAEILREKKNFISVIIRANRCEQDEEDILHNIFLSLVATPIPEHIECIDAYLYRIVINDIIDLYRQRKANQYRRHRISICYERRCVCNPIDTLLIEEESERIFHLAETKLPPYLWRAFNMRYSRGFTVTEISETLGVKKNVIRVYLSMALRRIRKMLKIKHNNKH